MDFKAQTYYLYNVQDGDEWRVHVYDIVDSDSEQKTE